MEKYGKMITPRKIAEAKRDYIAGLGSVREIAARHNIPEKTLQAHAYAEKWTEERSVCLALKPSTDFQVTLHVWRNRYLGLIAKVEEKLELAIQELKPGNTKGHLDCSRSVGILAEAYREVSGIPKFAPIRQQEKNEKQIPVETSPIESQATDAQSDTH